MEKCRKNKDFSADFMFQHSVDFIGLNSFKNFYLTFTQLSRQTVFFNVNHFQRFTLKHSKLQKTVPDASNSLKSLKFPNSI